MTEDRKLPTDTVDISENVNRDISEDSANPDEETPSINIAPSRFWNSYTIRIGVVMVALKAVNIIGQIVLERDRHRRAMEQELWNRSQG
ncbi:hypothetical protein [Streptomyces phage Psst4]|nr:hypothetical protein [Streptomyces phage Psst4]